MSEEPRPDPDALLARIKLAEAESVRAKLKVFFGMCAGSGKTYAMLEEARSARDRGVDIVCALVETHGRAETEALLDGLEALPRRRGEYRGVFVEELDLDAVLERSPAIALVDELAHTNAPGSKHLKRWQDVFELLDRGISVWTSVNIQHVESFADLVEDIAGVRVGERVPDSVIDRADELRLIDIAPEDLIRRLEEGKVYTSDSSKRAIENFFRPRNLGALRELALRFAAKRAERRLSAYARDEAGIGQQATLGERLLVAVGPAPSSAHLVRWTRRTAYSLRAEWIAVHVDTGRRLSDADRERLEANMALARKLGAETLVLGESDVARAVLQTARERGASMIVIGRSGLTKIGFPPRRSTVSDRIAREAGAVDVAVVQDGSAPPSLSLLALAARALSAPPGQYGLLAAAFLAVTILGKLLSPFLEYRSIALVYLAAVLALSTAARPAAVASFAVLSALALNFFFIPPLYTFTIGTPEDWILFGVYFLVAAVTGSLVSRLRMKERQVGERERRASFLFGAAQRIAACRSVEEAAETASRLIDEHYRSESVVLFDDGAGRLGGLALGSGKAGVDDREYAAAAYSYRSASLCGHGTDSLPGSLFRYLPAAAGDRVSGVIGIRPPAGQVWTQGDDNLLLSLGRTFALSVERALAEARSRKTALELESERLGGILLDTVSHELRTPLTTIVGTISALGDDSLAERPEARRTLLAGALDAALRLDRIVEDLLSLSRMEAGMLKLRRGTVDLGEIAQAAIERAAPELKANEVRVAVEASAYVAQLDLILVARLGANLLRNARRYSPPGSPVDLRLSAEGADLLLSVRDRGPGVPEEELDTLFRKFRRGGVGAAGGADGGEGSPGGGIGLGLAICKGIAEAHGGGIEAAAAPGGGLLVTARFPSCLRKEGD